MLDVLADRHVHLGDLAGTRGPDCVPHLHRFEHAQLVADLHLGAGLDGDGDDDTGDWRPNRRCFVAT